MHQPLASTLVITGGIGHSTKYLYDAVRGHSEFKSLSTQIDGLPEARVLEAIGKHFFDLDELLQVADVRLLVEDRSTNCGANAVETERTLEKAGIDVSTNPWTRHMIIQDPTMCLRTMLAFEHVYARTTTDGAHIPKFVCCPGFVPVTKYNAEKDRLEWDISHPGMAGVGAEGLWSMDRFVDLVLGEIPRLRDNESGYGPRGKNFIAHVDIPGEVEEAYERLRRTFRSERAGVSK